MRTSTWIVAGIFIAAGLFSEGASADQQPISWSGSGWYFERADAASIFTGSSSGDMYAGPYATEAACEATNPAAKTDDTGFLCEFEGTDPNSGNSQ